MCPERRTAPAQAPLTTTETTTANDTGVAGYLNSSRVRCITGQPVIVRARKDNAVEISSSYGDWKAAFTTQAAEELAHRIGLAAQAIQRRAA